MAGQRARRPFPGSRLSTAAAPFRSRRRSAPGRRRRAAQPRRRPALSIPGLGHSPGSPRHPSQSHACEAEPSSGGRVVVGKQRTSQYKQGGRLPAPSFARGRGPREPLRPRIGGAAHVPLRPRPSANAAGSGPPCSVQTTRQLPPAIFSACRSVCLGARPAFRAERGARSAPHRPLARPVRRARTITGAQTRKGPLPHATAPCAEPEGRAPSGELHGRAAARVPVSAPPTARCGGDAARAGRPLGHESQQ